MFQCFSRFKLSEIVLLIDHHIPEDSEYITKCRLPSSHVILGVRIETNLFVDNFCALRVALFLDFDRLHRLVVCMNREVVDVSVLRKYSIQNYCFGNTINR